MFFVILCLLILVIMNRIKEVLKEKDSKQIWLADKLGESYNIVNGFYRIDSNLD